MHLYYCQQTFIRIFPANFDQFEMTFSGRHGWTLPQLDHQDDVHAQVLPGDHFILLEHGAL